MKAVDQFKRRILDLAIRGKLVPQDPNDEPASELLARIRVEKAKLVKAGKIKKGKGSTAGSDGAAYEKSPEEVPFELPHGWAWYRLGEIAEVQLGKMLDKKNTIGLPYPYLANVSVRWGSFDLDDLTQMPFVGAEVEKFALKPGDVIMCEGGVPGRCAVWREETSRIKYQKALHRIRLHESSPEYVRYYFEAIHDAMFFTARFSGSTIHHLPRETLIQIPIPLPPLVEQKRIVARIEELFKIADSLGEAADGLEGAAKRLDKKILDLAIRGKLVPQDPNDEPASELVKRIAAARARKVAKGAKRNLAQSRRVAEIENPPFEIPASWQWVRLGEIFQHNTGKALNRAKTVGTMKEYITTSNVYWDGFKLEALRQMPFTDEELAKCTVKKGDLLICEGGDIGRAAIWNIPREICIQNHLHRLRPYDNSICVSYFWLVLRLYKHTGFIQGKGIGLQGFSSNLVHNLPIPLPPLAEQKRIVAKVDELLGAVRGLRTTGATP